MAELKLVSNEDLAAQAGIDGLTFDEKVLWVQKVFLAGLQIDDPGGHSRWLADEAAKFWATKELWQDFRYQRGTFTDDIVVFGRTNRVIWSIRRGFRCAESCCTPAFTQRFAELMSVEDNMRTRLEEYEEEYEEENGAEE